MAYAGVCVSGFIIAYRERSALALEISNITISVLIGAYVSFSLLLNDGTKGRVELQTAKQKLIDKYSEVFQEHKFKSILSDFLIAFVYGTLLGVALSPAQTLIKDIDSGIAMGMVTVVVAFVGWVKVKNKLTKRKTSSPPTTTPSAPSSSSAPPWPTPCRKAARAPMPPPRKKPRSRKLTRPRPSDYLSLNPAAYPRPRPVIFTPCCVNSP